MFRIIGANLCYIIYFHNNFLEKKKKPLLKSYSKMSSSFYRGNRVTSNTTFYDNIFKEKKMTVF